MAKVLIESGPVKATYFLREVPREQWRDLMLARRSFLAVALSHDCRCLIQFCNDAEVMFRECGFASAQEMIEKGYGLEPEEIAIALDWLRLNPPKEPIALKAVVKLARHGGDRRSEATKDQGANSTLKRGSTSRGYILARLDRDGFAELAAKVRDGAMSANAAAIEAGFRKLKTPLERVLALLPKLTPTELRQLRARLDEMFKPKDRAA